MLQHSAAVHTCAMSWDVGEYGWVLLGTAGGALSVDRTCAVWRRALGWGALAGNWDLQETVGLENALEEGAGRRG